MFEPGTISHPNDDGELPQSYASLKKKETEFATQKLLYILQRIELSGLNRYDRDELKLYLMGMIK